MNYSSYKFLVLSLLFVFIPLLLASQAGLSDGLDSKSDSLISKKLQLFPEGTQLAVGIIEDGEVSLIGAEQGPSGIEYIKNHQYQYELGSITKVFTSTLLAGLVISDSLDLERSVGSVCSYKLKLDHDISFKQLSNHTSGLPRLPSNLVLFMVDPADPYRNYSNQDLEAYFTTYVTLDTIPGTKYGYSNLGAGFLGHTLTNYAGRSYSELLQDLIFDKYDMKNSTIKLDTSKNSLVQGQDALGQPTVYWTMNALLGASGIFSTVEDLSNFALAQLDDSNLELILTHVPTHRVSANMEIGLGWHILNTKSRPEVLWHNGSTGGYTTSMAIDKASRDAVIVLSNVSAFHVNSSQIDNLCFSLLGLINEK